MWHVAVAAAVAGSGIIAKHIFSPNSHNPTSKTNQTEHNNDELLQLPQISNQISDDCIDTHLSFAQNGSNSSSLLNHCESENSNLSAIVEENDGVFLFSSSGSCSKSKKSRNLGKKMHKKAGLVDNGSVNQRKNCGKVLFRLKRRKTSRNSDVKCDSSLTKDCSSFGCGLGLGMMYMMSAGKEDISKLSNTIDETAKVVHELKSQLNKHKFVPCQQVLNSNDTRDTIDTMKIEAERANVESSPLRHDTSMFSNLADSDYSSSVLTEEQQHDGSEMDQLEAELESELQKLPWCASEASENIDKLTNDTQIKRHEPVRQNSTLYQSDGVPPSELQNKLSALLIEQQEDQISELESELNLAYSKLKEKEAELQAMKDCVRRLTEFSLSNVSDEDTEVCKEEQCAILDHQSNMVAENATVGTKRTMLFRTCNN